MPTLIFFKQAIIKNSKRLNDLCKLRGLKLLPVVKCIERYDDVLNLFIELYKMNGIAVASSCLHKDIEQTLISPISSNDYDNVVKNIQISYHGNLYSINRINQSATRQKIVHKIVLAVDMGDNREGVQPDNLIEFIEHIQQLNNPYIVIAGVMTNYACASGLMPTVENLEQFAHIAEKASKVTGIHFDIVSVGGSVVLSILEFRPLPAFINQIRIGEALLLGNIPAIAQQSRYLQNTSTLEVEIVDISKKHVLSVQTANYNALGEKVHHHVTGIRTRAILNFGSLHTTPSKLIPPHGFELVSVNSNCTVYDITETESHYNIGDKFFLYQQYGALLTASHSINLKKRMV